MVNPSDTSPTDGQESAPDTMSPAKRKRLQQCFERANELAHRGKPDFDYAHDLYSQAVVNDPGNLVYVEAMLDNLQKKYKNNKKGSRFSFSSRKSFKEAVADEEWTEVFREGLELLHANPWDTSVLRELAKACAYNRHNEVELRYLKNALDGKPKDADVNRHCAQSLARMGQFDMAIACWNRVAEKVKGDEPERMISELTLAKTMGSPLSAEAIGDVGVRVAVPPKTDDEASDGGEVAESDDEQTDVAVDQEEGEDAGAGSDSAVIPLNRRQTLEKEIREDPTREELHLELADIHSKDRRYSDAEKVLGLAIEACGASLKLQTAFEDSQIRSSKARLAIAEQRAASAKTDEANELVSKLKSDLNRLELDIYQQRSQRFPEKLRFHYELGVRLRRAGNFLQAVKCYDLARKDAHCQVAATLEMGECWQQLKQYSKALDCFKAAIEASSDVDGDRQKRALYRGAILSAALKQNDEARSWFQQLLDLDPTYKDAAARLDKLG